VRASEFGAARFLGGGEFHEFDAGQVGVVEVELPFAVSADLGSFDGLDAGFCDFVVDGVDVGNAERDVIHDAERVFIGVGRNIQHVLDPVRAVGNLHGDPAGFVVFHAAVPIGAEAENVFVEMIGGSAVSDDEAGVNDANRVGRIRGRETGLQVLGIRQVIRVRDGNVMSFGVLKQQADEVAAVLHLSFVKVDFVRVEISLESFHVVREKRHVSEQVRRSRSRRFFEADALTAGEKHELGRFRIAIFARMVRIDEFQIELACFRYVRNKNGDTGDGENARALWRFAFRHRAEAEEQTREQKCDLFHAITSRIGCRMRF
jgi:hypothetical protein